MKHKNSNRVNLGFENKLWEMADKLRGHVDASEYKHVVLGLIFLKYISDAFPVKYKQLEAAEYTDPEDRDKSATANIFGVPKVARWDKLQANAKQPTIGNLVDDVMVAIEKENLKLKGVLPNDYAHPTLEKHRLGEIIDIIGKIGLRDDVFRSKDILGRVYEHFLGRFAAAEGKGGGEFYTHSFEDSELGAVPEGWKQSTIRDEFDLTMGQSPLGSTYNETEEGIPFFQTRRDFGLRYPNNRVYERESTTLRDTPHPKHISGELRVPDAEKFIEGVGL